ncbi:hypothetical protein EIN_175760 [Entamoeba invadens IP1]|uniref:hypothetical protein n=1 Tax=Entamoeba invadens IP1 TaxID=370355 RepID=UPI0002C3D54A|nr:hypothetical protein EIN_175760 [Entamoeba invadens IP1]ELP93789.1 hypothetical protein EIN_175760 [Entamoeba invadens IP1]|eukprot:XP_004260560.1 hypothetical protein EIN_175760 [Entamoeba invadens IP1]
MKTLNRYSFALVGPVQSGKSSIFDSLTTQKPSSVYSLTTTDRYDTAQFESDNTIIQIEILDTPGVSVKESIQRALFATMSCLCLTIDVSSKKFETETDDTLWCLGDVLRKSSAKSYSSTTMSSVSEGEEMKFGIPVLFIGTHADIAQKENIDKFQKKIKEFGLSCLLCDAVNVESVTDLFDEILDLKFVRPQKTETFVVQNSKVKKQKKAKNCVIV